MTVFTLLGLLAAFDALDHSILLARLREVFGISGKVLEWFSSYLTVKAVGSMVWSLYKRSFTAGFLRVQSLVCVLSF